MMHRNFNFFTCDICGQGFYGQTLPSDSDVVCPDCVDEYAKNKDSDISEAKAGGQFVK